MNPMPVVISKEQLKRNINKTDQSCELVVEVSYMEHQNIKSNGKKLNITIFCNCSLSYYNLFLFIIKKNYSVRKKEKR